MIQEVLPQVIVQHGSPTNRANHVMSRVQEKLIKYVLPGIWIKQSCPQNNDKHEVSPISTNHDKRSSPTNWATTKLSHKLG